MFRTLQGASEDTQWVSGRRKIISAAMMPEIPSGLAYRRDRSNAHQLASRPGQAAIVCGTTDGRDIGAARASLRARLSGMGMTVMDGMQAGRPSPAAALDFNKLFAAIGAEHFFSEIWEKHPAVLDLQEGDFAQICDIVGPLEIERLASLARLGTQAWLSNQYVGHSVFPVDATTARQYFKAGATLYFLNVPLRELTDRVADALGTPRDRIIASLFLTAAQSGAEAHFDKNENFTIQLTGKKSWAVADAPTIPNPPEGYVFGRPVPPALKRLGLKSTEIPPGREYALTPGTMLYVPRGTSHTTSADEESWSLNISYTGLMWADLITGALHEHLLAKPEWRRSVAGLGSQANPAAKSRNIVPALLDDLGQTIAREELTQIMAALLPDAKR